MATIGTRRNSLKQQRLSAELETIIDDLGIAIRDAYEPWVATECRPTPRMAACLYRFYTFCGENYGE
jgi:hypothetical protein